MEMVLDVTGWVKIGFLSRCKSVINEKRPICLNVNPQRICLTTRQIDKKFSCCWGSSRYDKVSDSSRSANPNRNPNLCKFYFTNRVVDTRNSVPSSVVSANTL